MRTINQDDFVLIYFEDDTTLLIKADGNKSSCHKGSIDTASFIGQEYGYTGESNKGARFIVARPTYDEYIFKLKRASQIAYPKDLGYVILNLGIKPGDTILEAGCGSGGATGIFSKIVGAEGKVFSYEKRRDFIDLARTNLMKFSQYDNVIFKNRDIKDGIDETNFDSVFLDLPNPQDYMDIVYGAMGNSSMLGVLVPTTNQVSEILLAMRNFEFKKIDVWETFIRRYKTNPYRLRPSDIMVGHTAFLIFARKTLGLGKTKLEGEEYYEQEN